MKSQAGSSNSEDGEILALCQQMKKISSRIWLSSWSCQRWERVGVRTALSPGLGGFNTGRRDSFGGPVEGFGAVMGDMMSNNSTTDTSILEFNRKKIFLRIVGDTDNVNADLQSTSSQNLSSATEPKPTRVARQEQSSLQVRETQNGRSACFLE